MRESVNLGQLDIEIYDRIKPDGKNKEGYLPYKMEEGDIVPKMAGFGEGYKFHITGLVHDETGFPNNNKALAEESLQRLINKIDENEDDIVTYEEYRMEDAEEVIIAYGCTSRSCREAVDSLRETGRKIGMFRPITIWPSASKQIEELAKKVDNIYVIEMNMGQYLLEIQRLANKYTEISSYTRMNGELIRPDEIISFIKEGK